MPVYVDQLMKNGWILRGHDIPNCHMFTDTVDLSELHALAARIGMKPEWFQKNKTADHYDLTPRRRRAAISQGAIEVSNKEAVAIWRKRRELLKTQKSAGG